MHLHRPSRPPHLTRYAPNVILPVARRWCAPSMHPARYGPARDPFIQGGSFFHLGIMCGIIRAPCEGQVRAESYVAMYMHRSTVGARSVFNISIGMLLLGQRVTSNSSIWLDRRLFFSLELSGAYTRSACVVLRAVAREFIL
jgi:hypothetical protein